MVELKVMHRSPDLSDYHQFFSQVEIQVLIIFYVCIAQNISLFLSLFSQLHWIIFVTEYQVTN